MLSKDYGATEQAQDGLLRLLPIHISVEVGCVRLKRGCTELQIGGDQAAAIVEKLVCTMHGQSLTHQQICSFFVDADQSLVSDLIQQLKSRHIIVPSTTPFEGDVKETELDIFYWQFGQTTESVRARLADKQMIVVGVNHVALALINCLELSGFPKVQVIDDPALRNAQLFDGHDSLPGGWPARLAPIAHSKWQPEGVGCLIATADFGCDEAMRQWNTYCINSKYHFVPVTLHSFIGYIGPLVIPGETPCFECTLARWNSHAAPQRRWETADRNAENTVGFHPTMLWTLAAVTTLELVKFYGIGLQSSAIANLVEVNLLSTKMITHRVLKVPRCSMCSPLNERPSCSLTLPFGLSHSKGT
jgi:bacteriocin biosynthesis cyclodehydratase domain-containing protein